ncbi:MAG: glycosyltransferase [Elusimicrobiota bacterium]|jgi:glycosyltransferase involved in cell wall biosynthesis
MNILQIVNPVLPIPPKTMGGTERIVQALLRELVRAGHNVTLLAEDGSTPPAGVEFHGIGTYWHQEKTVRRVWEHLIGHGSRYDVIHNHGRLLYFLPRLWGRAAKVHTFHFGDLQLPQLRRFLSLHPRRFAFTPCGAWIAERYRGFGGEWIPVHNGLAIDQFQPKVTVGTDAPLAIIARMDPRKGVPSAIRVARATGRRLVIAGVIGDQPDEKAWFEENVLKECDGEQIRFIGPVDDRQKQDLLANAAAYLLPLQGSEAFTVMMIEALACGCPVIGFNRYCLPELVKEGVNGFLAQDENDMAGKVRRLGEIDRRNCRRDFEERFSSKVMAEKYQDLYRRLGAS